MRINRSPPLLLPVLFIHCPHSHSFVCSFPPLCPSLLSAGGSSQSGTSTPHLSRPGISRSQPAHAPHSTRTPRAEHRRASHAAWRQRHTPASAPAHDRHRARGCVPVRTTHHTPHHTTTTQQRSNTTQAQQHNNAVTQQHNATAQYDNNTTIQQHECIHSHAPHTTVPLRNEPAFHDESEFPAPMAFSNTPKVYAGRASRTDAVQAPAKTAAPGVPRRNPAPAPPPHANKPAPPPGHERYGVTHAPPQRTGGVIPKSQFPKKAPPPPPPSGPKPAIRKTLSPH